MTTIQEMLSGKIINLSLFLKSRFGILLKKIGKKEKLTVFILILLMVLIAVFRLLRPGFFTMFDDMQVVRVWQMDKCIKDFQIPCRWVPDLGLGYGYPLFLYYAPLPYYFMEAFHLVGTTIIASVKIGFIASVLLSAYFFFLFIRHLFSKKASLFATFLYVMVPIRASDIYVRGAMGEVWGMALVPLVFLGFENLLKKKDTKSVLIFSVTIGLLLISHNLTVLIFVPFMIIWGIVRLFLVNNRTDLIKKTTIGSLLGVGISSFFVLPLIFERNLVHIETLTGGYFGYLQHFLNLKEIFVSTHWGYGPSVVGPDDTFLGIGPIHTVVAILGLLSALVFAKKDRKRVAIAIVASFMFITSAFMVHSKSTIIWKSINILEFIQFPWRFVIVSVFAASILAAFLIDYLPGYISNLLGIMTVILVLTVYGNYFRPKDWYLVSDSQKLSGQELTRQITASIYDYLPKTAVRAPDNLPDFPYIEVMGKTNLISYLSGSDWYKIELVSSTGISKIALNAYSFPNWQVYVNDKEVKTTPYGDFGQVSFNVEFGDNKIYAVLKNTLVRTVGDIISLLSIFAVGALYLYENKKLSHKR